ncbi:MAG: outer membrane lipoprotein carrier protein LolA [Bacilli bacterium]
MKKILWVSILIISILSLTGCGEYGEKDIVKDLNNKIGTLKGYRLSGILKLVNNEEKYLYNVEVSFQNKNQFRVSLTNQINNHQQIILKNNEGVYVLTPSLNKSFKFESKWPYNNSQIYILQSLLNDINSDKNYGFKKTKNNYIFKTTVNYPNNKELVKQKIYLNKKGNMEKVEVLNLNNEPQMTMKFNKINLKADFSDNYFMLKDNMKASENKEIIKPVNNIDNSIYPMYLPKNTYLEKENKVNKEDGQRVIMTFNGDNPFMIIQETVNVSADYLPIPVSGEPVLLTDSIGAMAENEVTWIDKGIEYYIVSKKLKGEQLISVAKSIGVASVIK